MNSITSLEFPERGDVIAGRYRVHGVLGTGGMSCVWEVEDLRTGERLAAKGANPHVSLSAGRMDRLIQREASLMAGLDHPSIPKFREVAWHDRRPYIVMELVRGKSLSLLMREERKQGDLFDERRVIGWGIELCGILEYLHESSVIYRDMKPENVILRDDGGLALVDFGISLRTDERESDLPEGTPGYSAPEQLDRKGDPAPSADVYALGATLYSLVTGVVPQLRRLSNGREYYAFEIVPIRDCNPLLSEGLESALVHATQTDPSKRYATVAELRNDLVSYRERSAEYAANGDSDAGPSPFLLVIVVVVIGALLFGGLALGGLFASAPDVSGGGTPGALQGGVFGWAFGHIYSLVPIVLGVLATVAILVARKVIHRPVSLAEEPKLIDVLGVSDSVAVDGDHQMGEGDTAHFPSYADASRYRRAFVRDNSKALPERVPTEGATVASSRTKWFNVQTRITYPCAQEIVEWAERGNEDGAVVTVIDVRSVSWK